MDYYLLPSRASGKRYMQYKQMFELLEQGHTVTVIRNSKDIPQNNKNRGDVIGKTN